MPLKRTDWTVLLYNFGVVYSGAAVVGRLEVGNRLFVVGVVATIAAFWTIYFRYRMMPRIRDPGGSNEEEMPVDQKSANGDK
ncbi:hypothetical protein [Halosimplex pelagicum]|uniref:DUF8074 domain-containing protein n=1 Tax=Halosimplex pelagicum TaxID=869886 RepID=A0A7D5TSJ0_9EURY|nr:hypothetical protein [Halosimplex pelagicum]QLH82032.1 hypothetical protein HZS54_10540 [Halosimplex pelagicum]